MNRKHQSKLRIFVKVISWTFAIFLLWSVFFPIYFGNGETFEIRLATGYFLVAWDQIPASVEQYWSFTKGFEFLALDWSYWSRLSRVSFRDLPVLPTAKVFYTHTTCVVPLWPYVVPILVLSYLLRRFDCKKARDACHACGYNLTGNVSGICPECGTPVQSPPS